MVINLMRTVTFFWKWYSFQRCRARNHVTGNRMSLPSHVTWRMGNTRKVNATSDKFFLIGFDNRLQGPKSYFMHNSPTISPGCGVRVTSQVNSRADAVLLVAWGIPFYESKCLIPSLELTVLTKDKYITAGS